MYTSGHQNNIYISFLFYICLFPNFAYGQSESLPELLSDGETDQSELNEWIAHLEANPIDINNDTPDALMEIPYLTKAHIDSILHYRPFKYKSQIRTVLGYDMYKLIRPFIMVKKSVQFFQMVVSQRLRYSLNHSKGFLEKIYLGTVFETLTRIRLKVSRNFSSGFLIQKDPGEISYSDHSTSFVSWHPNTLPIQITLGNYLVHCAEGLLLSSTYSLPKIALVSPARVHRTLRLKPYLSSNEYDGFWGAAIRIGVDKGFKFVTFYSKNERDAIKDDSSASILRLDRTGYHRTVTELSHQNYTTENTIGIMGHIPFFIFSQIGLSYVKTSYEPGFLTIQPKNRRRNFFRFQGSFINNYSFFYAIQLGHLLLHGEMVPRNLNTIVHKHSLDILLKDWGFSIRWSYFPVNFQSPFGRSIADSNPFPTALQQYYVGSSGKINDNLRLSGFWYFEKELWRSYFQPLPQIKKVSFFQTLYRPFPNTQLIFRYQYSSNFESPPDIYLPLQRISHRYRIQIEKDISTQVRLCSRFEKSIINYSNTFTNKTGTNFYQSLYLNHNQNLRIKLQFSSFSTVDYDSRIYEYESDLPGVFSNFPLFGSGNKWYLLITAKPLKGLKIWMKFRQINFDGVDHLGSGLSLIKGSSRQDLHFQIEYHY